MENVIFGHVVNRIRKELGLTIVDLSRKTDIPAASLRKILLNQGKLTDTRRHQILEAIRKAQRKEIVKTRMKIVNSRIVCLSQDCKRKQCKFITSCMIVKVSVSADVILTDVDPNVTRGIKLKEREGK